MFKNDTGFTLVEFLVAIVILMVGLLGLLQTVNFALQHNLNTQLRNEAVTVADNFMAREMAKSFDNVSTTTKNMSESRQILGGFKMYSVQRSGTLLTNSKMVNIRVWWKHKGSSYSHETSSVISKNQ